MSPSHRLSKKPGQSGIQNSNENWAKRSQIGLGVGGGMEDREQPGGLRRESPTSKGDPHLVDSVDKHGRGWELPSGRRATRTWSSKGEPAIGSASRKKPPFPGPVAGRQVWPVLAVLVSRGSPAACRKHSAEVWRSIKTEFICRPVGVAVVSIVSLFSRLEKKNKKIFFSPLRDFLPSPLLLSLVCSQNPSAV